MGLIGKKGTVYGLIDPECKELFYIGCTVNPASRLSSHVNAPTHGHYPARMLAYLRRMRRRGYRPTMVILEKNARPNREFAWIEFFKPMVLLNTQGNGPKPKLRLSRSQAAKQRWAKAQTMYLLYTYRTY